MSFARLSFVAVRPRIQARLGGRGPHVILHALQVAPASRPVPPVAR